ncbi:MAG: glycosyltransferase family 2 protein, partial [Chloroflexi bacterium]|nr:glycosyltransferase family 2 protein [Chloroflexota bacterium]
MKLSVIIPCFNAEDTIAVQLEALVRQRWGDPWEVIVSDNGSTDGTLAIVEQYTERLPHFRIVDSSDRKGAAHARNVGALAATGKALAFCDADDEVAPGWLSAIGDALSEHDFVASRMDEKKLNRPLILKARGGIQQDGLQKYTYPPYLPHSGGCGLGVKKTLHERVGGFDETMRQLEDTDYCWRIQLSGTPLYYVQDALVHIRFPETLSGVYRQACVWAEYNVLIYNKYRPLGMPKLTVKTGVKA